MDAVEADLRAQLRTLEIVTSALWANWLGNSDADPIARAREVAARMRAGLEANAAKPLAVGQVDLTGKVLANMEAFWFDVEGHLRPER